MALILLCAAAALVLHSVSLGGPLRTDPYSIVALSPKPKAADVAPNQPPAIPVPPPPGATPSKHEITPFQRVGSPYLHTSDANYEVPMPPQEVYLYYAPRLQRLGYVANTQGESCGPKGPCMSDWAFQRGNYDWVVLTVDPLQTNHSRYSIEMQQIVPPPRPRESIVPADVQSLTIEMLPGGQGRPIAVTSPSEIAALRRLANRLPMDTRGVHGCAADTGVGAILRFLAGGKSYIFTEDRACASVKGPGGVALEDTGDLWNALLKAAHLLSGSAA